MCPVLCPYSPTARLDTPWICSAVSGLCHPLPAHLETPLSDPISSKKWLGLSSEKEIAA